MSKKTLVLGASLKTSRYSNLVIHRLVNHKQNVVAIGLREGEVSGIKIETDLIDFDGIDTITLYLNPVRQQQYYEYIVSLQPKKVIFNPGTENPEFYNILKRANIEAEVACTLVLLSTNQY
ncbi:CoA-binding protein [uncultured Aquimarina sp.]|uniref:CoA-binding protein n=1 Tax=uncultured Aquimarina sp. TaxID=575652 RepID=UPI00262C2D08|nr:CoA-binding protein [uncultured Aquimarina sp.]